MDWDDLNIHDRADLIKKAVKEDIYNLNDIRSTYNTFGKGGYIPSENIKKRISNWEGASMKTNRSFSAEATDFNRYLPKGATDKLSQQQLDALYSYSYNVGAGNFNKRVVPVLNKYLNGNASKEDVQRAMYATKDNQLRGLTTRRNAEREMFGGNYRTMFTGTGGTPNDFGYRDLRIASSTNYDSNNNTSNFGDLNTQLQNFIANYKGVTLDDDNKPTVDVNKQLEYILSSTGAELPKFTIPNIARNDMEMITPDYSYSNELLKEFDNDLYGNINQTNEDVFAYGSRINKFEDGGVTDNNTEYNFKSETGQPLYVEDGYIRDKNGGYYSQLLPKVEVITEKPKNPVIEFLNPANLQNNTLDALNSILNNAQQTSYEMVNPPMKLFGSLIKGIHNVFGVKPSYSDSKDMIYDGIDNTLNNGRSRLGELGLIRDKDNPNIWRLPKEGTKEYEKACAKMANIMNQGLHKPTAGDAWTRGGIYGDSMLVNGYVLPKGKHYSRALAEVQNRAAAELVDAKLKYNDIKLNTGDIVGLYYSGSPKQKRAFKEGKGNALNTHTGNILSLDPYDKSKTFVVHNMSGNIMVQPIGDLLGGTGKVGITYIKRPYSSLRYNKKALGGNLFFEGGPKNKKNNSVVVRGPMPAHPDANRMKKRSWETQEEYEDRIKDYKELNDSDLQSIEEYNKWQQDVNRQITILQQKAKEESIRKANERAARIEKELTSLRGIPEQMNRQTNDTVQTLQKGLPVATKKQEKKNVNLWKPAIQSVDLGLSLASLMSGNPWINAAGMLVNGIQLGDDIAIGEPVFSDGVSLIGDGISTLGKMNRLPTAYRLGNRTLNIDKMADYTGAFLNGNDVLQDSYDIGKLAYNALHSPRTNTYFSPFSK